MWCIAVICFAQTPQWAGTSEYDGIIGGHEYVDLGLPSGTLWATYNVGAKSPYEKGQYFAWGEVEPREDFSWESYKYYIDHFFDPEIGFSVHLEDIGSDISGTEYDAARHQWGNGWRLPNEQERYELRMLCWWKHPVIENGVRGVRLHGPNEHSIFLPVCGFGLWYGELNSFHTTESSYWTGAEDTECLPIEPRVNAKSLMVDFFGGLSGVSSTKAYGMCIRAVVNPKESGLEEVLLDDRINTFSYRDGYIYVLGYSKGMVNVYDLSGRYLSSFSVIDGKCQVHGLSTGVYLISFVNDKNTSVTKKITIK